ncbi:HAD family hydrolase [Flavobacterium difficile]|uniref:HAD family hydrolase n=1 Tax=Flavobacterium difficile TaxID=2709659 RepID=A0ABX0I9C0_9FLAO|nr:HAD family hydrolase [Flavobacterium difficile]NHM02041.1 HAD family hydrolase [Flavobacterium difficile]
MLQTVIFDMDGVIVDTEPVHHYAYFKHFEELNIEVSEEMFASFTGNSTKNVFQKIKDHFGIITDTEVLVQRKRTLFNEAFDTKEDLFLLDGVEDLMKKLHQKNIQMVLASSASKVTIERIFNRFNLHQYFSHVISGEDFPQSKPNPAIFNEAVRLSNTPKEHCIIIEDSTNGIKAAHASGVFCVGYKSVNSHKQDYSLANIVIDRFEELDIENILK